MSAVGRVRKEAAAVARDRSRRVLESARVAVYAGRTPVAARLLPPGLRRRWRLEAPPAGERRIEVGSGWRPTPGYVHVDTAAGLPGVDVTARADELPFPSGWADELLSVHMIEHVPAPAVAQVLRHWHDRLRPGGVLEVHTPNGAALGRVLADPAADRTRVWAAVSALYGYGTHPERSGSAGVLGSQPDHKVVLTFETLRELLEDNGFADVQDLTGQLDCQHQRDWAAIVPGLCLEVRAIRR